jgi:hypothetical protein
MDLMKYIENLRRFREREGYLPAFGETRRCEQRDPEGPEAVEVRRATNEATTRGRGVRS